jgi:sulfur relay (sulfurtransferase) complex TusBCD TusD component (DsrE family)
MAKFVFVLSAGTESSSKPTRCMQFAQIAKEEGHEVHIFLTDDGVVFAKKGMAQNVASINGDEMMTYLEFLQDGKVPIYV